MKHLIIQDHNLSYLVYFRPKDKARMYEIIYKAQQKYFSQDYGTFELLDYITTKLNENGFKVVDLSQEIKKAVYVRCDFNETSFFYKNIRVRENEYGYCFTIIGTTYTCPNISGAIETIDKVVG